MRVLWLTFIPSPYRLRFFEELAQKCDLTVLFERRSSKNRKGNWDYYSFNGYKGIILRGITVGGFDKLCPEVTKYLRSSYDIIVISNPTSPTGILAAAILSIKGIQYLVESDGAFPTNRKGIKLLLKRFVMSNAKYCLSTAKLHDEYYIQCGVKPENIRRYPFTSIGNDDLIDAEILGSVDKQFYKNRLGIKEKNAVLSVGRFSYNMGYGKGFDILLNIAELLNAEDIGIYIVGDEPTADFLKQKRDRNLDNVHFIGFKRKEELAEYYAAANVFVLLSRGDVWGLVINEAMMYGLPIIASNKCIAGLEMVENGINGYICSLENTKSISDAILKLIRDQELINKITRNNISKAKDYTYEKMAIVHVDIFREALT